MAQPTLRLEAPGLDPLAFLPAAGWIVDRVDLGTPEPREQAEDAPDADGQIDTTSLIGARDIIVAGTMFADVDPLWRMKDRLAAFMSQRLRPTLYIAEVGQPERQAAVRGRQYPRQVVNRDWDEFQAVFRVSSGVLESATPVVTPIFPGAPEGVGGLELPVELPVEFVGAGPPGAGVVVNEGTADASPVLRIDGPCTGPIVENRTVGRSLVFDPAWEILAGEYLEIDVRAKTILLNGIESQSRYDKLVFAESAWWTLPAQASSDVRFTPVEWSPPSRLTVTHRHAWL